MTQDTQSLDSSAKSLELQHAPLWDWDERIALEHPELQCVCVDLEASENQIQSPLLAEILQLQTAKTRLFIVKESVMLPDWAAGIVPKPLAQVNWRKSVLIAVI
ncbi:MAG UNVERIFIED_CONTAM: hypothetical protein LVR29_23400 [Microcystis novacekii LVE1205-3]